MEEEQKECKGRSGWSIPRKQRPLNQHGQRLYELTEKKAACIGHHGFAPVPLQIFSGL